MATIQQYTFEELMRDRRWFDSLAKAGFRVDWQPIQRPDTAPTERPPSPAKQAPR